MKNRNNIVAKISLEGSSYIIRIRPKWKFWQEGFNIKTICNGNKENIIPFLKELGEINVDISC